MPGIVIFALVLYILTVGYNLWGMASGQFILGGLLILILAFILYKIFYRRKWARIALFLVIVLSNCSIFGPRYLSFAYDYFFDVTRPQVLSAWTVLEPIVIAGVQLVAAGLLFTRSANAWFRSAATPVSDVTGSNNEDPR